MSKSKPNPAKTRKPENKKTTSDLSEKDQRFLIWKRHKANKTK